MLILGLGAAILVVPREKAPKATDGTDPGVAMGGDTPVFSNRSSARFSALPAYAGVGFADALQSEQVEFTSLLEFRQGELPANPDFDGRYTTVADGRRAVPESTCRCRSVEVWLVGGSVAFGLGQRDEATVAAELVRLASLDDIALRVVNLAVPGVTLWQEMEITKRFLASRARSDRSPAAIVSLGGYNDAVGALASAAAGTFDDRTRNELDFQDVRRIAEREFRIPADLDPSSVAQVASERYEWSRSEFDRVAEAAGTRVRYYFHPDALADGEQLAPVRDVYRGLPSWTIEPAQQVLAAMSSRLASGTTNLRHLFDDLEQSVFVDWAHTNEKGAAITAAAIYADLAESWSASRR